MDMLSPDLLWPIAGAVVAGAVIGGEREYRASPAGLRTHIPVALSWRLRGRESRSPRRRDPRGRGHHRFRHPPPASL